MNRVGGPMLYIILAVLMFGLLIAVHEFGHFASAKLFGIQVNEFSVGMGPTLCKTICVFQIQRTI